MIAISVAWAATATAEVDVLDYELRDLESPDTVDLAGFRGSVILLMFFEPDCTYCLRQTRILNDLISSCEGFQPIGVGVNGTRRALQGERRRLRADFPLLQVSAQLQAEVGDIIGTPVMLLTDTDGRFVTWAQGIQSREVLLDLIGRIEPSAC
ncbi:MAG: conjugal transfer protein TraF [Gammaproteobacteria bacterium]|nr:conjugal transfer protein TraF [Gammaproteobacteria bacterium]